MHGAPRLSETLQTLAVASLALCVVAFVSCAQPLLAASPGSQEKPSGAGKHGKERKSDRIRTLQFPPGAACGMLYRLPAGWMAKNSATEIMAQPWVPARSTLSLPAACKLALFGDVGLLEHADALKLIPSDAFECLVLNGLPFSAKQFNPFLRFTTLKRIELRDATFGDEGMAKLKALPNLEAISADGANVRGSCFPSLAPLKHLQQLTLGSTKLSRDGFKELGQLKSIVDLDLSDTGMVDADVPYIAKLPNLQILSLQQNAKLTATALKDLRQCKTLSILNICETHFVLQDALILQGMKSLSVVSLPGINFSSTEQVAARRALPKVQVVFAGARHSQSRSSLLSR